MKATQKIVALGLSAALSVDALGGGAHVAPPSPPRCSADGACYPKHNTWGYYGQRWRTWPGVELAAAEPQRAEKSVLGEYDAPPPEEEERQAPPPLETSKPEGEEGAQPPVDTPPLNLPPLPSQTPPAATPQENGQAPPPLPFERPMPPGTPPTFRPLPGTETTPEAPPRPMEVPLSPPPGASLPQRLPATAREQDAPPTMPLHLTQRTPVMLPAPDRSAITLRRLPSVPAQQPKGGIMPAAAVMTPGDRPRALPAVYVPPDDQPPALPSFGK